MAAAALEDPLTKGKGKTEPRLATETTPLLEAGSNEDSTGDEDEHGPKSSSVARRRFWKRLTIVFLFTFSISLIITLLLALLAYSYTVQLSYVSPDDILSTALVFQGPDQVDVINATDGGLWIRLGARVGVDAGSIIGVNANPGAAGDLWKSIGRLGIRILGTVTASVATVHVSSDRGALLANISAQPVQLPITSNPPHDSSWLTHISLPVFVQPTNNASDLAQFLEDSWRHGAVSVRASIPDVTVWGGSPERRGWRSMFTSNFNNVETQFSLPIPPVPGLPKPGEDTPLPSFSQLVSVESFNIFSTDKEIQLNARASIVNPTPPGLEMTIPALPFVVSLPTSDPDTHISIASAETQPFSLTHPNVTLLILGRVLPLPATAIEALSAFASRYLSLQPNPISISSPLLPSLVIDTDFPSPATKPKVLRDVTIRNMKVKPYGTDLLASGEVFGLIVLPKGMNFQMEVRRVMPDILVFDGDVDDTPPPLGAVGNIPSRLPQPLPPGAFGHIQPNDWLDAQSVYDGTDEEGSIFSVSASIVDVPIQVLPGREGEFSKFVSKVLFGSNGATAGLRGTVDVGVDIIGLPFHDGNGEDVGFQLKGLPLQGQVHIGKKA